MTAMKELFTMVSKMYKGIVKRLARLEELGVDQLFEDVPKKRNTSVPKKRKKSVRKRSGLRASNLSKEEEESASSQDSEEEDEDEKIEDDFDDEEEDNEADEEHKDEVDDEEGDSFVENVTQDQEEDEEDDDDDNDNGNDDADDVRVGMRFESKFLDEPNSGYANAENDLQILVASNGNAEEVTKPDIAEDIDKQNGPIEYLNMDEGAQVEEERFEGAQFEEVLVYENTNEKRDYDDGDGYLIGSIVYTNSIVSWVVGELDVDQQLDRERTITDDVAGAPREELTLQTTSKAIHESKKDGEGNNACMEG
ncbi:hypothetical protein V2J09_004381 [Rumex salicifolius]